MDKKLDLLRSSMLYRISKARKIEEKETWGNMLH
jgi:hypothetical protein